MATHRRYLQRAVAAFIKCQAFALKELSRQDSASISYIYSVKSLSFEVKFSTSRSLFLSPSPEHGLSFLLGTERSCDTTSSQT